jgi:hypothetical protein
LSAGDLVRQPAHERRCVGDTETLQHRHHLGSPALRVLLDLPADRLQRIERGLSALHQDRQVLAPQQTLLLRCHRGEQLALEEHPPPRRAWLVLADAEQCLEQRGLAAARRPVERRDSHHARA